MSDYKGYNITTTIAYFPQGAKVTEAGFSVRKGERSAREDTVDGPFNSPEDAHVAAESAARGWIDQQREQ